MSNDDIVWYYSVLDTTEMTKDELQTALNRFTDSIMPSEVCHSDGKLLVIRYQSALNRAGHNNVLAERLSNTVAKAAATNLRKAGYQTDSFNFANKE